MLRESFSGVKSLLQELGLTLELELELGLLLMTVNAGIQTYGQIHLINSRGNG